MNAKCKYVISKKKYRTNLVIASPKKQEITQRNSATLNIKFNNKFSAKRSERNSICERAMHNHANLCKLKWPKVKPGICSTCQPEPLIF